MFILTIDLNVKSGLGPALEQTYKTTFLPAISRQEGFAQAALLRPNIADADYRLVLRFESQILQQKWVATPLHQEVWSQIESHCVKYTVQDYTLV